MNDKSNIRSLISALSKNMSDSDLLLAGLQGMIAADISIRRVELGMSQAQFAEHMGVSQSTISKWEAGDVNFTLQKLVEISSKLDIKMQCPYVRPKSRAIRYADGIVSVSVMSGRWVGSVSCGPGSLNDWREEA